jgi:hypothetical protein
MLKLSSKSYFTFTGVRTAGNFSADTGYTGCLCDARAVPGAPHPGSVLRPR